MAYSQASAAVRTRLFGRLALLLLAVGGVILSLGALADLLLRQGWPVSPPVLAMLDPVHDEGLLGDWSTLQLLALAAFLCWCALERAGLRLKRRAGRGVLGDQLRGWGLAVYSLAAILNPFANGLALHLGMEIRQVEPAPRNLDRQRVARIEAKKPHAGFAIFNDISAHI